jgi:hypothetical protein
MKKKTTGELVGAIVGNILGILFVNTMPYWRQWTYGVVQESWADIVWAANLSMAVQIGGNLLLILYRPPSLYALLQAVFAAVSLISIAVFYAVFPLDFSQLVGTWLNTLLRFVLIVAMVATAINCAVYLVRLVLGKPYTSG